MRIISGAIGTLLRWKEVLAVGRMERPSAPLLHRELVQEDGAGLLVGQKEALDGDPELAR